MHVRTLLNTEKLLLLNTFAVLCTYKLEEPTREKYKQTLVTFKYSAHTYIRVIPEKSFYLDIFCEKQLI